MRKVQGLNEMVTFRVYFFELTRVGKIKSQIDYPTLKRMEHRCLFLT